MNEQNNKPNKMKFGGFLRRGASRLTLGLGSSTLILAVTTAVALVAVSTVAWLSANRTVQGTQAMDIGSDEFQLGRYSGFSDDANVLKALTDQNYYDLVTTTKNERGLYCALTVDERVDGNATLRPGATGQIRFRIIPAEDGFFSAKISLSALVNKLVFEDGVYKVAQDTNGKDQYVLLRAGSSDFRDYAVQLLKGHILVFADAAMTQRIEPGSDTNSTVLITGPDGAALDKNNTYMVTLYWTWPRFYSVLRDYLIEPDTYVAEHSREIFYPVSDRDSTGYDNADKEIGSLISHVAAEVNVHQLDDAASFPAIRVRAQVEQP